MKKLLLTLLSLSSYIMIGQVGINTTTPHESSILDITSTNKGLLIPRVSLTSTADATTITGTEATSLLVYNTATVSDVTPGFYYWNGTQWIRFQTGNTTSNSWLIDGNSGTTSSNFLGTTDNRPIQIGINSVKRGEFNEDGELHVYGDMEIGGGHTDGGTPDSGYENLAIYGQSKLYSIGVRNDANANNSDFSIMDGHGGGFKLYTVLPNGVGGHYTGITESEPETNLHVTEDKNGKTSIRIDNTNNTGNPNAATALDFYDGSSQMAFMEYYNADDYLHLGTTRNDAEIYFSTNNTVRMSVATGGAVNVVGNLSKGGGTFKIDHPLDPENKYLYHSFVESPDMMNVYNGNCTTDVNGVATIELPEYFEALNKDFRYQLTTIASFSRVMVKEKINNNRFTIQTEQPNIEVSWQVTGIRKDPYAEENRVVPEVEKEDENKGKYLHPKAYKQPQEKFIYFQDTTQNPE